MARSTFFRPVSELLARIPRPRSVVSAIVAGVAGLTVILSGCDDAGAVVPVTGAVVLDGRPAGGVGIAFWPVDEATVLDATNSGLVLTGDDGTFALGGEPGYGFRPGTYKVTFTRVVDRSGHPAPLVRPADVEGRETIPARYRDRATTPVTVTVGHTDTRLTFDIPGK